MIEPAHFVLYTGQPAINQKDLGQHIATIGIGRGRGDVIGKGLLPTPYSMTGQSKI